MTATKPPRYSVVITRSDASPHYVFAVYKSQAKAKAVAAVARDDVQMDVEHFLPGGLAIGQQQIHALAPHAALPHRRRQLLRHAHELRAGLHVERGQVSGVRHRHHQQMPRAGYETNQALSHTLVRKQVWRVLGETLQKTGNWGFEAIGLSPNGRVWTCPLESERYCQC